MTLETTDTQLAAIREHGRLDYPEECCGVLLGRFTGSEARLLEIRGLTNVRERERRRRFLISPRDYLETEREARRRGLELLGFYHSHPDAPARPSAFDREQAWPNFHYIVVEVAEGRPGEVTCWVLSEDRAAFVREELKVVPPEE